MSEITKDGNNKLFCRHSDCNCYDTRRNNYCRVLKDVSENPVYNKNFEIIGYRKCPFYKQWSPEDDQKEIDWE